MTIRRAAAADIDDMVSLLGELFEIEDDFAIDPCAQRQGLELLLNDPDATLLVADAMGSVVGMATMQRFVSTAVGEYVGLIEDVVVTMSHRGNGIGSRLLQAMLSEATRQHLMRLALAVDVRNLRALSFYGRYGFRISRMGMLYRAQPLPLAP